MLAIAQALAGRPSLLLLDEPSSGLAPAVVAELFQRVRQLATAGMTVMLVEQLATEAISIADHVTILNAGSVVASGAPELFHDDEVLRTAYFAVGEPSAVPST